MIRITDGGRAAAGFKGEVRDCVTRAITIATGKAYRDVYDDLKRLCRGTDSSPRTGIDKKITRAYMASLGWEWVPTMKIGSGCKVHLSARELPSGRIVVQLSRHVVAVINGVIHDNHDSTRDGSRCVYGYWKKP